MSSIGSQETLTPPEERVVRFVDWTLRDAPLTGLLLLALCVAVGIGSAHVSGMSGMGAGAGLALVLAFWKLWIPIGYEIGPQGIGWRVFRRQYRWPWYRVRRFEIRRRGLLVSCSTDQALEAPSNLFVPWHGKRDEILALVAYYLGTRISRDSVSGWSGERATGA